MKLRITVHGVSYDVEVEVLDAGEGFYSQPQSPLPRVQRASGSSGVVPDVSVPRAPQATTPSPKVGGAITSPIAGNVITVKCKVGDHVQKDQILLVIEAMKMETSIAAPTAGKIKSVDVSVGDSVRENQALVQFE